jgi:hypothetical protein
MAHRVKEVEREQRNEIKSMRTSESQELGSSVAQEMEKKRKLAELKRLQVLPIRTVALTCGRPADFLFPCYLGARTPFLEWTYCSLQSSQ